MKIRPYPLLVYLLSLLVIIPLGLPSVAQSVDGCDVPAETAEAFFERGVACFHAGESDRALADLTQAINLKPDNPAYYSWRADVYRKLGSYDDALVDYTQAIALDPTNDDNYSRRGYTYYLLEDYNRALPDMNWAIEHDEADSWAYRIRGRIYYKQKDYDAALVDYDQSLNLSPDNAYTLVYRGDTYRRLGEYERALADYQRALEINPKDAQAYRGMGNVYYDQRDETLMLTNYYQYLERLEGEPNETIVRRVNYVRNRPYILTVVFAVGGLLILKVAVGKLREQGRNADTLEKPKRKRKAKDKRGTATDEAFWESVEGDNPIQW